MNKSDTIPYSPLPLSHIFSEPQTGVGYMPTRNASATWEGGLKGGKGRFSGEGGSIGGQYSFTSRFEDGVGTNPEELLAAAEASCYSMALSGGLEKAGATPKRIDTKAACTVE